MSITTDPADPGLHEKNPDGQNKSYLVLAAEEIQKGYVRPFRRSYIHTTCGAVTTMGPQLSETWARDPKFYGATFCATCRGHYPVAEFRWDRGARLGEPGEILGSDIDMSPRHDCACGKPRKNESDLLCPACWLKVPQVKREGLLKLRVESPTSEEYRLAGEQIFRILRRMLEIKPQKAVVVAYDCAYCGEFEVIHTTNKPNQFCACCGSRCKVSHIVSCASKIHDTWSSIQELSQDELQKVWAELPSES